MELLEVKIMRADMKSLQEEFEDKIEEILRKFKERRKKWNIENGKSED